MTALPRPGRTRPPGLPGIRIDAVDLRQATELCATAIDTGAYLCVGVVNAAKVVAMRKNAPLRAAVLGCGMVLADGQAVVWASALLGAPLPERVTGIDLFTELLGRAERRGYRVFFLGATADVLRECLAEVRRRYPALIIAGSRDGYFSQGQEQEVADAIRRSGTDLLFIGMSSPRKELFGAQWGQVTGAKVIHGVGGSFDILAGLTRRAPRWWQRHGLEWLYRVLQEPGRLGRRYLTTNLAFIALVARAKAGRGGSGEAAR